MLFNNKESNEFTNTKEIDFVLSLNFYRETTNLKGNDVKIIVKNLCSNYNYETVLIFDRRL